MGCDMFVYMGSLEGSQARSWEHGIGNREYGGDGVKGWDLLGVGLLVNDGADIAGPSFTEYATNPFNLETFSSLD